jgi:hypothetical protein
VSLGRYASHDISFRAHVISFRGNAPLLIPIQEIHQILELFNLTDKFRNLMPCLRVPHNYSRQNLKQIGSLFFYGCDFVPFPGLDVPAELQNPFQHFYDILDSLWSEQAAVFVGLGDREAVGNLVDFLFQMLVEGWRVELSGKKGARRVGWGRLFVSL